MTLAAVRPTRGLERGLRVLRLLQVTPSMSLHELHLATHLSKATLSRVLLTLQREGFAAQRIADNRWSLGVEPKARRRRAPARDRLSQIAAPILDDLCARIIWPSDLSVRVGTHMEVCETSRAHSSLMLGRLRIGFPINLLLSAPGRAYLAYSSEQHREHIIGRICNRQGLGHDIARSKRAVDAIVNETLTQGYGARDPTWGGHISKSKQDYDDGLNAIAAPIIDGSQVVGCVNIVWIRALLTREQLVRRHLADLRLAAEAIGQAYREQTVRTAR